jgi:Pyruvate/2-oxoacid:ferredoxin oxidoreductase delta subunit
MPAFEEEIKDALREGIKIFEKKIINDYKINNGKIEARIVDVEKIMNGKVALGKKYHYETYDAVVFAIGQFSEETFKEDNSIFIGGDLAIGASTVTEAISSGKRNAFKILSFLGIINETETTEDFFRSSSDYSNREVVDFDMINTFYFKKQPSLSHDILHSNDTVSLFDEIYNDIVKEAERCFNCGICNKCGTCWFYCPDVSVVYEKDSNEPVDFDYQHCKGCGVCSSECPRGVIEMEEDK